MNLSNQQANSIPQTVIESYSRSEMVPYEEAERRAKELAKFLAVCSDSSRPWVPSNVVDTIWHEFILHTSDYAHYCSTSIGRFVHHSPQRSNSTSLRADYLATVDAIATKFGPIDEELWPTPTDKIGMAICEASNCSRCNTDPGGEPAR